VIEGRDGECVSLPHKAAADPRVPRDIVDPVTARRPSCRSGRSCGKTAHLRFESKYRSARGKGGSQIGPGRELVAIEQRASSLTVVEVAIEELPIMSRFFLFTLSRQRAVKVFAPSCSHCSSGAKRDGSFPFPLPPIAARKSPPHCRARRGATISSRALRRSMSGRLRPAPPA